MGPADWADVLLLLHFAYVLGVVLPVPLIAIGAWRNWRWVRNVWFRAAHLAMVAVVVAFAAAGRLCPLTVWESDLRERAGDSAYTGSWVAYWISRVIYYEIGVSTMALIYAAFALLVLALLVVAPPERARKA